MSIGQLPFHRRRWILPKSTWWLLGWSWLAFCPVQSFGQSPRVPARDDEILERLPRTLTLNRDRMALIRERLTADPDNVEFAAAAAQGYIKMGNDERDPRFYGYARAAIDTWWSDVKVDPAIGKTRAKLKEKDHEYLAAIDDLEAVLEQEPRDKQAWIELINLYRVVGKYEKARSAIKSLAEFADKKTLTVSRAPLLAATGQAEESLALLQSLQASLEENDDLIPWSISTQAGIEASLGRVEKADEQYRKALSMDSANVHLKRTYAEFLLDNRHPSPVIPLLKEHQSDNGCLLLMALAAKHTNQMELLAKLTPKLETRFREIRLRGSRPHGRFESLFELVLKGDSQRALQIALENWQLQKEIRDSRIVLECASVAKDPDAAGPVMEFLRTTGCQDVALLQLMRVLEQ